MMMARQTLTCIILVVCVVSLEAASNSTPSTTTLTPSTTTLTSSTPSTTTLTPSTPSTTTLTPSTPSTTTLTPSTPSTTTLTPSTTTLLPSPTAAPVSTIIPDTFYYNCTENGGIAIIDDGSLSDVTIQYLNQASSNCSNPTIQTDGSFLLANCTKNSTVDVVLEATNGTDIIGGHHSKIFQIKCEDVNIKPYFLNVTANENVDKPVSHHVITMATTLTPSPISTLNMTITDKGQTVAEAYIGQALTIAITIPVVTMTKNCSAGSGSSIGRPFRFLGTSKSITITCRVRICPAGYKGTECDLTCLETKRKRKRINRLSDDLTMEMASTSLAIKDPLLTSGAGRLGFELNTISWLAVAALVFVNKTFVRG